MINFAVINLKSFIKNLLKITIVITLSIGIMNIGDIAISKFKTFHYSQILKNNLYFEKEQAFTDKNIFQRIIIAEIPILASDNLIKNSDIPVNSDNTLLAEQNIESNISNNSQEITNSVDSHASEITENVQEASEVSTLSELEVIDIPKNVSTAVISANNLSESYNTSYGNVKIKNETNYNLTDSILTPDVTYSDVKNILIFHTHTCESYTQTQKNSYTPSGNYRTTDLNYSVAKVGSVLTDCLTAKGYNVNHNLTYHDYPSYNGSYSRSFRTVSNELQKNPSTQLVIDLHRDAVGSMNNYAPCVQIGDEIVSQIMFVIGTNGGGLEHPNWKTNLKFAIKIQSKANEMYPGLFRPIIVRNSRYNQNLADSACIIEVGATGNTLEQTTRKHEIFGRSNK